MMPYVAAILLVLLSGVTSLVMVTMLCMGGANSTPEHLRQIKGCLITVIVVGLVCLIGSIWSMVVKRPWVAAGIGGAPLLACIAAFVVLWRMGR